MPAAPRKSALMLFAATLLIAATPAAAQNTDADDKSAAIFTYFAIGRDERPEHSVTREQFTQQIDELAEGGYNIMPLPGIAIALRDGKALPPRTVGISFDEADSSILEIAAPLLFARKIPFTVFIPADRVSDEETSFLSWEDLRKLKRSNLASFGVEPSNGSALTGGAQAEIKRQINNSLAKIRDELDVEPEIFAYPYGIYNPAYQSIVKEMGFSAAFAQQSGIAHAGADHFALPRFTLTENYSDMDRFRMAANALPLPVTDIAPADPMLHTDRPAIGFTLPDSLAPLAKKLTCFSSSNEKPNIELLGNRVEIRFDTIDEDRLRLNCTMPYSGNTTDGDARWRWLGLMFTMQDAATLPDAENPENFESHE